MASGNDIALQHNLEVADVSKDVDVLKSIHDLQETFKKGLEQVNTRMDNLEGRAARSHSISPSRGR